MENLCLAIDMILHLLGMRQVEIVLVHSKGIVFNRTFGDRLRRGGEWLLIDFAYRLAMLVPDDVPIPDLLINRWIVDQRASSGGCHC